MSAPIDLDRYLITLESVRRDLRDIPREAPSEYRRLAALIVQARGVRRSSWEDSREQPYDPKRHGPLSPIAPPNKYEDRSFVQYKAIEPGSPNVVGVHITDKTIFMRELYVPTVPVQMNYESFVEQVTEYHRDIPEAFRIRQLDNGTESTQNAYRAGGDRKNSSPSFHDYEYLDTIEKAKQGLFRWGAGELHLRQVAAWAWPMLWLRFDTRNTDIILVPDRSGQTRALISQHS